MAITPEQLNDRDSAAAQQSCATRAPEHVTDKELAEIERPDHEATPGPLHLGIADAVADERVMVDDRIRVVSAPSGTRGKPYLVYVDGEMLRTTRRNGRRFASEGAARAAGERRLRHALPRATTPATLAERIEDVRGDFAGLAADLHKANEDAAAISRVLDEAGITAREGETLRERVERLVALSHDRMTRLLGADTRAEELRARAEKAET